MKLTPLILIFAFIAVQFQMYAQGVDGVYAAAANREVATFQSLEEEVWLPMAFGKSEVKERPSILEKLGGDAYRIMEISVVYSDYPKGLKFHGLNQRRLKEALDLLPKPLQAHVKVKLVRQISCTTLSEAKALPHGVSIRYEKKVERVSKIVDKEAKEEQQQTPVKDSLYAFSRPPIAPIEITAAEIGTDSTVLSVMKRNGDAWNGDWLIVTDLTYSMEPFTWQVLLWQQEIRSRQNVQAYVFFNDGDQRKDELKPLGRTGGIYATTTAQPDSLVRLMQRVQEAGNGGDIPENDLEALGFAQQHYPEAAVYVLIADAKSSIRDFELLETIRKPVKVILARTEKSYHSIPLQYVELALKTKGSLHTDYFDFHSERELKQIQAYHQEKQRYYEEASRDMRRAKRKKGKVKP